MDAILDSSKDPATPEGTYYVNSKSNITNYQLSGDCEGTTVQLGAPISTEVLCQNGEWSLLKDVSSLSEGEYDVEVLVTNEKGQSSSGQIKIIKDLTPPKPKVVSAIGANTATSSIPVNIIFDEVVTEFAKEDINITNGTITQFKGSGRNYAFVVTPSGLGNISIGVPEAVAVDRAKNDNSGTLSPYSTVFDNVAPIVTFSSVEISPTSANPIPVTVTISEPVTDFNFADLVATNGTMSNFVGSGASYSFDLYPSGPGAVTVYMLANAITDAAGNQNDVPTPFTIVYNNTTNPATSLNPNTPGSGTGLSPSVVLASNGNYYTNQSPIPFCVDFSQSVTGLALGDINVTNGTAQNLTGSGQKYCFEVVPSAEGAVDVAIANSAATAGVNATTASNPVTVIYDITQPTVVITTSSSNPTSDHPIVVDVTFSEDVENLNLQDITVTNAQAANLTGSGTTYQYELYPTSVGTVSTSIPAGAAQDYATNDNLASNTLSRLFSTNKPLVTLSSPTSVVTNVSPMPFTATFNREVTGFLIQDIDVINGIATNLTGSGTSYSFTVLPSAQGQLVVQVPADVAVDVDGLKNLPSAPVTRTYDGVKPTPNIQIFVGSTTNRAPVKVAVTFDEDVTGFSSSSATLTNATIQNFAQINAKSYTFEVLPVAAGTVTVAVNANRAQDLAGNGNIAAQNQSFTYDPTPQTAVTTNISPSGSPSNNTSNRSVNISGADVQNYKAVVIRSGDCSTADFSTSPTFAVANTYTFAITTDGDYTVCAIGQDSTGVWQLPHLATASDTLEIDTVAPEITSIATRGTFFLPTNGQSRTFYISASEPLVGFTQSDVSLINASVNSFSTFSPQSYIVSLQFTQGTVVIDVPNGGATDDAGNALIGDSRSFDADWTSPTPTLSTASIDPTSDYPITVNLTFDEAPAMGNVAAGIRLNSNAYYNNFSGSGMSYSFDVYAKDNGIVSVKYAAGTIRDAARNWNVASNEILLTYSNSKPAAQITSTETGPSNLSSIPITVTFNRDVTGFTLADLSLINATATNFTMVNASTYSFDLVASADATLSVQVPANSATDADGDGNLISTTFSIDYDSTAPTVTVAAPNGTPTTIAPIPITINFNENITNFTAADLVLTNATVSGFSMLSATSYSANLTPIAVGSISASVSAGGADDLAGNASLVSNLVTVNYTGTSPSSLPLATISDFSPSGSPSANISDRAVNVAGNNVVSYKAAVIYNSTNCATANFAGATETAVMTPFQFSVDQGDGSYYVCAIGKNASGDWQPNTAASISGELVIDTVNPTPYMQVATVSLGVLPNGTLLNGVSQISVQIDFGESISGLAAGDLVVTNATVGAISQLSDTTWDVKINPSSDGAVTVSLPGNTVIDTVGLSNIDSNLVDFIYDGTPPTFTLSTLEPLPTTNSTFSFDVDFSEEIKALAVGQFTVSIGSASLTAVTKNSATNYTVGVTALAEGPITVQLQTNLVEDIAGNMNGVSDSVSFEYDDPRPSVTISSSASDPTNTSPIPFTVTFEDDVTGFDSSDIGIVNATIGNFIAVDGKVYTFDATPSADGDVTVTIAENIATAGIYGNFAASPLTVSYDTTAPTVVVSSIALDPTNLDPIPITITFSEEVTGFGTSDIAVNNGAVTNLSGGPTVYTLNLVPSGQLTVSLSVPGAAAQDLVGLDNSLSNVFSTTVDTVEPTVVLTTSAPDPYSGSNFTVTATFSEDVTTMLLGSITVTNGTASNLVASDARTYSFDVSHANPGDTVSVVIANDGAQDAAGNGNLESNTIDRTHDNSVPPVSVAILTPSDNQWLDASAAASFAITGTCSEAGRDVEIKGDVLATVTCQGDNTFSYTSDFSTFADGPLLISVEHDNVANVIASDSVSFGKDTVAPTLFGIIDDKDFFSSTIGTPEISYNSFFEATSGIASYEYQIGTSAGAGDLITWTNNNTNLTFQVSSGLTLSENTTYYASVRATDLAGNVSTVYQGDGWVVDVTPPSVPSGFDDGIEAPQWMSPRMTWTLSTDGISGIDHYEVAVGTTSDATDVLNFSTGKNSNVGNLSYGNAKGLALTVSSTYYGSVRAVDKAGNASAATSGDGFTVINVSDTCGLGAVANPTVGNICSDDTIYIGKTSDHRHLASTRGGCGEFSGGASNVLPSGDFTPTCTGSTDTLIKGWSTTYGSSIDSGANSIDGSYNTALLMTLTGSWYAAAYCNSLVFGGHNDWYLPSQPELLIFDGAIEGITSASYWSSQYGTVYTAKYGNPVTGASGAINKATGYLARCVRELPFDPSQDVYPPSVPGNFSDGTGSNKDRTPYMRWDASIDVHMSIDHYEIAIGTSIGGTNVLNFSSVGKSNVGADAQARITGLSLTPGVTYYASVRALDTSGNISSVAQGDGFVAYDNEDPCDLIGSVPSPGDICADSSVYVGQTSDGRHLVTTRGGCTDFVGGGVTALSSTHFVPACVGGPDSLMKHWSNTYASGVDSGANSQTDGVYNTSLLMSLSGGQWYAANYCSSMAFGSYEDWYLPARNEFTLMDASVDGLQSASYWASEYSHAYNAIHINPVTDSIGAINKHSNLLVRCVRELEFDPALDVYPPSAPGNFVDGISSNKDRTAYMTWDASADAHTSIDHYEVAIGTTLGGTDVLAFSNLGNSNVGSNLFAQVTGLSLTPGATYYASIRSVDMTGNASVAAQGDGFTVYDNDDPCNLIGSSPSFGDTCADNSIYIGQTSDGRHLVTTRGGCADFSGGGAAVLPSGNFVATCSGGSDSLTKAWSNTNGSTIDSGANSQIDGASNTNLLMGLSGAWYAAGYCNAMAFTAYDDWYLPAREELKLLDASIEGVPSQYYWTSEYYSSSSAVYGNPVSDSIIGGSKTTNRFVRCVRKLSFDPTLDIYPPTAPANFSDGTGSNVDRTPILSWDASVDIHTSISHYEVAIGTTLGGQDVLAFSSSGLSNVGNDILTQVIGLSLTAGQTYYASLRAVDLQGNISAVSQGDGFTVYNNDDPCNLIGSSPSFGDICADNSIYIGQTSDGRHLVTTRGGCTDFSDGGATSSPSSDFVPTCAGGLDTLTKDWSNTNGSTIDSGANSQVDGASNTNLLMGLSGAWYAAGYCNAMAFTAYDDWYLPAREELKLLDASIEGVPSQYYWTSEYYSSSSAVYGNPVSDSITGGSKTTNRFVRCIRKLSFDPTLDIYPPTAPPNFVDGTGSNKDRTPYMKWDASTDVHTDVDHYEIAIGTTLGGTNVLNFSNVGTSNVGLVTMTQITGLSLTAGTTYYASIRAIDIRGNISTVAQGDGFIAYDNDDPCNLLGSSPSVGDICADDSIYLGKMSDGRHLVTTRGGCTDFSEGGATVLPSGDFTPTCAGGADSVVKQWSDTYGSTIDSGANSQTDGAYNTNLLMGLSGEWYPASYCNSMDFGAYADWYLPAREELYLFDGSMEGIQSQYYWTSEYSGGTSAIIVVPVTNAISGTGKTTSRLFRCVRNLQFNSTNDSTPPTVPANFSDGTGSNVDRTPILSWDASTDFHTSVSHYEVAIGTTLGGQDVLAFSSAGSSHVGNNISAQITGLSLTAGQTYYASLRAVDIQGNTSAVAQGDGFLVYADNDPCGLKAGTVAAGTVCADGSIYVGLVSGKHLATTPGGCSDFAGGGTTTLPSGNFVPTCSSGNFGAQKKWSDTQAVNPSPEAAANDLDDGEANVTVIKNAIISDGYNYYAAEYCDKMQQGSYDDWYLPAQNQLIQLLVASPMATTVRYWASNVVSYTSAMTVKADTLGLLGQGKVSGTHYIRCARSLEYNPANDVFAPTTPTAFNDGTGAEVGQTPYLSWTASTDEHTYVDHYEIAVGTTAGGEEILPFSSGTSSNVGNVTNAQITGLAGMVAGNTYYASIRAVDAQGNISSVAQGDGFITYAVGDPCDLGSSPSPGDACGDGSVYIGQVNGIHLATTPGGCTDFSGGGTNVVPSADFNPVCTAGADGPAKAWSNSSAANPSPEAAAVDEDNGEFNNEVIKNAIISDGYEYYAYEYCNKMNYGSYSDWYLPSQNQLVQLFVASPLASSLVYWTSNVDPTNLPGRAMTVRADNQTVGVLAKGTTTGRTRCIRSLSYTINVLVIGGGGGGGANMGGGGGAGEVIEYSTAVKAGDSLFSITVGAGGIGDSGNVSSLDASNDGQSSSFGIVVASGGGGAGGNVGVAGRSGGSGGGGGGNGASPGGTAVTNSTYGGFANAGGIGTASGDRCGGGGGGAGSVGVNGASGGHGGSGRTWFVDGVTYAGGGGGGCNTTATPGSGVAGGGDGGGISGAPLAGAANTGGGGGGGINDFSSVGGNGGSGVVIISYPGTTVLGSGGTITNDGTNTYHTFTSDGTYTP